MGEFSLTTEIDLLVDGLLVVTNIYASCACELRPSFLAELVASARAAQGRPSLVFGDFNLTRDPNDRNNGTFDAVAADVFNTTINVALLQELPLLDRLFTWTNHRDAPTLVRLDRAFIYAKWGSALFNSQLETLPRPVSDHVLLLVTASSSVPAYGIFRFERGWAVEPSYRAIIEGA
jgi:endonuclease/exonuclease/phosphatase family metal-dependent hydrolase